VISITYELYKIPEGKILIAFSDKTLSVGTIELNPKQELPKHNRPVLESLFQLKGTCVMKLFEQDGKPKEVTLKEGDTLDIPPHKYHIHSNPGTTTSITFWKASGDITGIIDKIRKNSEM